MQQVYVISLALSLVLAGCSTSPEVPTRNPFDDTPTTGHSKPRHLGVSSPRPIEQVTPIKPASPPSSELSAIAIGVTTPPPLISIQPVDIATSTPPKPDKSEADLAFDEAMRLGSAGDGPGKVGMLEQAGRMGSGDALYEMAKVYQEGSLLPQSTDQAVVYLTMAHGLGHMESARVLGLMYLTGNGVTEEREYGILLLDQASETSIRAMREYGQLLSNLRKPYLNDPAKGEQILRRASAMGDAESSNALAILLARQGNHADAQAVAQQAIAMNPASASRPAPSRQGSKADLSAEATKTQAFQGDLEAIFTYALKVSTRKFPSVEPEFESYCWYSAAAQLGLTKAKAEVRSLEGARVISDRAAPGRMDKCIADIVEVVSR